MREGDALDRALADRKAIMLEQFRAGLLKGLIGGEVDDDALQRPRATQGIDLRLARKRTHATLSQAILRLQNRYLAELRMPAEFFLPWRCIPGRRRIACSVAATRFSAQLFSASRPNTRISSTIRSSAASASFNSPPSPSTATAIDAIRFRSPGFSRRKANNASSLNFPSDIRAPFESIRT
jgi:hypothetical protein